MADASLSRSLAWWQQSVIYQIYPRSFQDSDGDGVGDLPGIVQRLDYLSWLGVGALWISPFYASPMVDFGYDITDFCAVDPLFGNEDDFRHLLTEAHRRGIRIILDLVPNHTSDRHPWFRDSSSSQTSARRDWYIWRDPGPDGGPPNNWLSEFGGSAWTQDAASGQFYYHAFLPSQPDLNWRNPEVRAAIHDVMRFWLDAGVDGFRVDAVTNFVEDELLRDDPPDPDFRPDMSAARPNKRIFTIDRPETHDYAVGLREVLDAFPDRVFIGEIHLPVARAMSYFGEENCSFHLPFNFELLESRWSARDIAAAIDQYTILLPKNAWANWVLGNHDESRLATRLGVEQARIAAMLLMTLKGTPFLYYGDELGMRNGDIPAAKLQDPRKDSMGTEYARDPQRTPMLWSDIPGGGFTSGEPWLPLNADYRTCNVEAQQADPRSMLTLYRRLIQLRKTHAALVEGEQRPLRGHSELLVYERLCPEERILVVLNFSKAPTRFAGVDGSILLSTALDRDREQVAQELDLQPHEGVLVERKGKT